MDINKLREIGEVKNFATGETIIYQGLTGNEMYFILKGSVKVFVLNPFDGTEAHIAELGPGDVFGEMSLFLEGKRTASIRALEPCTLFSLTKEGLDEYIELDPSTAVKLMKILAKRIVHAEGFIKSYY